MANGAILTKGNIPKIFIKMTSGMLMGYFAMVVFNITDTFFVSRLGTEPLAAMSFSFPVVMVVFGIVFGIGVAASSIIAKAIGKGDQHRVNRLTTDALILTLIVGLFITVLGLVFSKNIFRVMGATGTTLEMVVSYMNIWFFSFVFIVLPMVANNAIRATGDTITPGIIMAIASILNMILDPIFIFGFLFIPKMGIRGAAVATVIARVISLFASFYIVNNKLKMLEFDIKHIKEVFVSWKEILYLSIPTSITHILLPLTMGIVTKIVSSYGDSAVAAIGAGSRIDGVALMIIFALASVTIPFVGQNLGAKNFERICLGRKFAHTVAYFWGLGLFVLFIFIAPFIAKIFSTDNMVFLYLRDYLRIISLGYFAIGLVIICSSELVGLQKPVHSTLLNAARMFVFLVPLVWILGKFFGVVGIFSGITIANIIGAYMAIIVLNIQFGKIRGRTTKVGTGCSCGNETDCRDNSV